MTEGITSPEAEMRADGVTITEVPSSRTPAAAAVRPHLKLLDPRAWTKPAPPRQWIVQDWIPRGAVTALYGDGGIGKSLVAQQLLTSTALALSWLGLDTYGGRALGIFCEDDEDELHRRQDAINAALGVEAERLENLRLLSRVGADNVLMDFTDTDSGKLTEFFRDLDATVAEFRPALVVLDTAADLFGGNENIRPQVRRFIGACLGRLAREHDCAVLLLAHPSQAGLRDGSGTGGSTAWNNTVRSRLYFTRASTEEGVMPDRRVLTRMKANYAPADARLELEWRAGAFAPVTVADDIDPATWPAIGAMFDEIERAWNVGSPWSSAPQTRDSGRYFPSWVRARLGVPEKRTKRLLSEWLVSGCLINDDVDTSAKKKGLKVLRRPDR